MRCKNKEEESSGSAGNLRKEENVGGQKLVKIPRRPRNEKRRSRRRFMRKRGCAKKGDGVRHVPRRCQIYFAVTTPRRWIKRKRTCAATTLNLGKKRIDRYDRTINRGL